MDQNIQFNKYELCESGTVQSLGDILIDKTDMVSVLTEHMDSVKQHKLVLFNERIFFRGFTFVKHSVSKISLKALFIHWASEQTCLKY